MTAITKDISDVAAEWWCKVLVNPKFDNLGPTRGRDVKETVSNTIASIFATHVAAESPLTEESLNTFKKTLSSTIVAEQVDYLFVDYGPDAILSSCAKEAGIASERFPWKTSMVISEKGVMVSYGYRAPATVVYQKEDKAEV